MICPSSVAARLAGSRPTGEPSLPFEWRPMPSRTSQRQVQPAAVVLEHVDDAQALLVVPEPARAPATSSTRSPAWPNGVWPRSWPSAIDFGQLLVQPQHLGDRAGDLRDLERVRQPRAVVVARRREEHLRLVLQPPERLAVDDAVAVVLKRRPHVVFRLRAAAGRATRRSWRPAAPASRARAARAPHGCSTTNRPPGSSCRAPAARRRSWRRASGPRSANVARVPMSTPRAHARAGQQHRHVLARMIGARRRRIVAVVGGDDQQVVRRAAAAAPSPSRSSKRSRLAA